MRRFIDNAMYLVNHDAKLIYSHANARKVPEVECADNDLWWSWLGQWGGDMNEQVERFAEFQVTSQIEVPLQPLVQLRLF